MRLSAILDFRTNAIQSSLRNGRYDQQVISESSALKAMLSLCGFYSYCSYRGLVLQRKTVLQGELKSLMTGCKTQLFIEAMCIGSCHIRG